MRFMIAKISTKNEHVKGEKDLDIGSKLLKPPAGQGRPMAVFPAKLAASNQSLEQTVFNIKKECKIHCEIAAEVQRQ